MEVIVLSANPDSCSGACERPGLPVSGMVLADQIKSLDWSERRAEFIANPGRDLLEDVLGRLAPLLGY